MIISCPTCATRYTLGDSAVGPEGRKVRCAKCGHMWWQMPVEDEPDFSLNDDVTEVRASAPAGGAKGKGKDSGKGKAKAKPRSPADRRAHKRAVIGWAAFVAVLALLGAGGVFARDAVVALWPPAALLYETVGLPVNPPGAGLQLQNVRSEQKVEGGASVLIVDGQILNVSGGTRMVPRVRAVSLDQDRKPVKSWTIDASPEHLLPGEIAVFRDAQRDPGAVTEVMVTFEGG